ncbi:LysE family translocator [Photorhabdus heterorhabditis]|uniref:LysE family translocator n=1 Tax=Photorhabdus heterorhabditis TaxID=880156 RepID=A0A5B0WLM6_9GAMM|nr:LysE family translocator [Photorhabdus heterorhabditis]KAA1187892.1 LysE family translocator [Photorhabdus heterorhabditis]KOY63259.1 hypothetical protein AM629_03900 [Photorhabdus heterorhabditis]MBS9440203.1 LysE family translocator [Photorhabdus heterorhabditis]
MNLDLLYFYLLLVVLSYITPGPDWAIISKGTFKCRKNGLITAIGVQAGLVFHLILGSLGATLILATSKTAFNILQTLGALYLIYLGYIGLKDAFNSRKNQVIENQITNITQKNSNLFITGLLANIFNPKVAIFFISILPQFIDPSRPALNQVIILGLIDILIGVLWWAVFVNGLSYIQSVLFNKNAQLIVESITSSSLLLFGVAMFVGMIIS